MKLKLQDPEIDTNWTHWVIGIGWDSYLHWTEDARITDLFFHLGPVTFMFALKREYN